MTRDLLDNKKEAYGCLKTKIGEICVFDLNGREQLQLHKLFGKSIKKFDSEEFVRNLSIYICYPKEKLEEDKYKPKAPIFSLQKINKLSESDLEKISILYINNNEYLFKKYVSKKKKSENHIQYLHRFFIIREEKLKKQMEKIIGPFSNFSPELAKSIKKTLELGESLNKTIEKIRHPWSVSDSMKNTQLASSESKKHIKPIQQPTIDCAIPNLLELDQKKEELRLKSFNNLSDKMDKLVDVSTQNSEIIIEGNENQVRIADEIRASSNEATKYSKSNLIYSKIIIGFSILTLAFAAYTLKRNNTNGNQLKLQLETNNLSNINKLSEINLNLTNGGQKKQAAYTQLITNLVGILNQKSAYEKLFDQNISIINKLKSEKVKQSKQIYLLENKLKRTNVNLGKQIKILEKKIGELEKIRWKDSEN